MVASAVNPIGQATMLRPPLILVVELASIAGVMA